MLESRAARADGSAAPLWLQRADACPLRRVELVYGGAEALIGNVESFLWAVERRRRRCGGTLSLRKEEVVVEEDVAKVLNLSGNPRVRTWEDLLTLLEDITEYAALGALGGADQRVCDALQPLLLRLMKVLLSGSIIADEEDEVEACETGEQGSDEAKYTLLDHIISAVEHATVNCGAGVARRTADTMLVVDGGKLALCVDRQGGNRAALPCWLPGPHAQLTVTFGFADYSTSETAALLWAGAIGLSSFLAEKLATVWSLLPSRARATTRVVEVGCGPALVSLTLAQLLLRYWSAQPSAPLPSSPAAASPVAVQLNVTDLSEAAVDEARRSFASRNGPDVAHVLCPHGNENRTDGDEAGKSATGDTSSQCPCCSATPAVAGLHVHTAALDLGSVPPHDIGQYDLLLASDIVYDHALTRVVAPALVKLLAPGGLALLCCEAHRDSMSGFLPHVRDHFANVLRVEKDVLNVEDELQWLKAGQSLSYSSCRLMFIRRLDT